jgi:hypothetical protein
MPEMKERIESGQNLTPNQNENQGLVELRHDNVELPPQVEHWMTRLEKNQPAKTVTDDQTGQTILKPTASSQPKVILPVTRKSFNDGFQKKVEDVGRWLSEFIFRLIKIHKGEVSFKDEQ